MVLELASKVDATLPLDHHITINIKINKLKLLNVIP
jgi:hypothetical protein